jgi:hypothetical protein
MNQQLMPFDYEGREIRVVKDEQGVDSSAKLSQCSR